MADGRQAIERIAERYPDAIVGQDSYRDQHWVEIKLDSLTEICAFLRDDPESSFDHLVDVTAVHWPDDPEPMEIVYHLYSLSRNDRLRIKARAAERGPVPSMSSIWESANWNERETYDMFGVEFAGHPDPRRILMPDEYTEYPLRKELPLYRG